MAKCDLTDYERIARWMIKSDESIGEVAKVLYKVYPTEEKLREEFEVAFEILKEQPWPWGYAED